MSQITRNLTQAQVDTIEAIVGTGSGTIISILERDKLGFITVTGAVDLDTLASSSHSHSNLAVLDLISGAGSGAIITTIERTKLGNLTITGAVDLDQLALDSHTHSNKAILDAITASYTTAEQSKLTGIETGATADQTNIEIKTAYELNTNTNAFTDANQTKLTGIETAATADQTGAEIKVAYEAEANTNAFTDAEKTKLGTVETNAKDDQSATEVPYSNITSGLTATNSQAAIDEIDGRIDTIEAASGEQNTASNVGTGSGIFKQKTGLDLEFKGVKSTSADISVSSTTQDITITFDNTDQSANTTARHDALSLGGVANDATDDSLDLTGQVLTVNVATITTDGVMSAADKIKLDAVEGGASADQNASEVPNTPSGNLVATNVQDALNELQTELDAQTDDQTAAEVSYNNATSGLTATDAQAAIDELENEIDSTQSDITTLQGASHDALTLGGVVSDTTDDTLDLVAQVLTVNLATTISDGAMSAADKAKIDGLSGSPNRNIDPANVIAPPQITANVNDYNPTGFDEFTEVICVDLNANREITGLQYKSDWQSVIISNDSTSDLKFKKENTGSLAANRFSIDADYTLRDGYMVECIYNANKSRWFLIGTN